MARTKRSRAKHEGSPKIFGRKNPGLCTTCFEYKQHLYPNPNGSGLYICYGCKKAGK